VRKFIAFCIGCLLVADPAIAGREPPAPMALSEHDRVIPGGRAVLVELPQSDIGTDVDVGRVVSDANQYGGGLIGALILGASDDKRERLTSMEREKATAHAAPLRQAMRDFDFDGLAVASTRSALSHLDWFGARDPEWIKSPSDNDRRALISGAGTKQLATITYHYHLSPDFTQIRVVADVTLWQPAMTRAAGAQPALTALFGQRVIAIAELRKRSYEPVENVALWSADKGKLARASITAALARLEQLIPFALNLNQADIDALARKKSDKHADKIFVAGFYGPPVTAFPGTAGEKVIWSQGLIAVMPTP
jgi:hypothetical protein